MRVPLEFTIPTRLGSVAPELTDPTCYYQPNRGDLVLGEVGVQQARPTAGPRRRTGTEVVGDQAVKFDTLPGGQAGESVETHGPSLVKVCEKTCFKRWGRCDVYGFCEISRL